MNSIRIGNDINIAWSITRCGDAEPLTLSALSLYMTCGYRKVQVQDFKVDGNKITFTFRGKDQANTGIYGLTLVGNAGQDGMFTVDACGAFKLVGSQCAGCLDTDGVEVDLLSDIQAPANGLSAYEIAVLDGFQGTEEEWLASLKQPAVDAAEEAGKAAQSATDAAGKADTAAGNADKAAKAATKAAGSATEAAAQATEAAGDAGNAASAATQAATAAIQAASGADSAKNAATKAAGAASQAAETANEAAKAATKAASEASGIAGEVSANNEQWEAAESQRQAAETKRQQDTQEAISGANTARDAANQAAQDANTAAEAANEAAQGIDEKIATKQDTLVSGENIKTVNGIDVLGNGNIVINPTIMDLKWTTNVATTRKLVPAELRSKGVKIAYRDNNSVYHVEQYQVEAVDDASWANDSNWKGCRTPMTPLFENAGATFNDETGYYEMNELTDLTEGEIYNSYSYTIGKTGLNTLTMLGWGGTPVRTNFRPITCEAFSLYSCSQIETFNIIPIGCWKYYINDYAMEWDNSLYAFAANVFYNAPRIRKIIGIISLKNVNSTAKTVYDILGLEEIKIKALHSDLKMFSKAPKLNYITWRYMIDNASNISPITITVHPTTYGYLTGTIEPTPEVGGTKEEWMQIVTDAQAKQITFATPE